MDSMKKLVIIIILLLTLLFFLDLYFNIVSAVDLNPNETVSINGTTVHCVAQDCNATYCSNIEEYVRNINDTLSDCLDDYPECVIELHDLAGTIDFLNDDITDYKTDIETCEAERDAKVDVSQLQTITTERDTYKASYEALELDLAKAKTNQWYYAIGGGIIVFALTWWYFNKRVSPSKGTSTHVGLTG